MARILIVDDEPSYREPLRLALAHEGYEVETAANGSEAVELGNSFLPDVLVVDCMLRDRTDGIHIAETLQQASPKLRTIVMSGYPTATLQARVEQLSWAEFLAKPFRLQELLAAIRGAVESLS